MWVFWVFAVEIGVQLYFKGDLVKIKLRLPFQWGQSRIFNEGLLFGLVFQGRNS